MRRCGVPEVIYAEGKTSEQVIAIVRALSGGSRPVLVTRVPPGMVEDLTSAFDEAKYHALARCLSVGPSMADPGIGRVGVVTAGTSDQPVAEEACLTAAHLGARVERFYDVGVAGLHRLLSRLDDIRACRVLVVVAGMEGALPSVVGGLTHCPLVAVPTSVGYGMNLDGLSALLAMLNSCAAGITVVNVDNGFGAGVAAALINRLGEKSP
jgi:NCAIR mutase (PurE)-related protein